MKPLRLILVAVLFLAPLVARAQGNPNTPQPDPPLAPSDPVVAQESQPQMPPPPPPVRPTAGTMRMISRSDYPGAIGGYEPLGGVEFGGRLGAWWKNSEIVSKLQ